MKVAAYTKSYYDEKLNCVVLTPLTKSLISLDNKNDTSAIEVNKSVNNIIEEFFNLKKVDKIIKISFENEQCTLKIKYYPNKDMYKFKINSSIQSEALFWENFKNKYKLEYQFSVCSIEEFVSNFGLVFTKNPDGVYNVSFANNNKIEANVLKEFNPEFADNKFKNDSSNNQSEITSIRNFFMSIKEEIIIPHYQRDYMWNEEQISQLMNDLFYTIDLNGKHTKYNHFLGNVVLTTKSNDKLSLVDGQQRLTTFMLLFSAITDYYGDESNILMNAIYTHESKLKINQKKYVNETLDEQLNSSKSNEINNKISININKIRKMLSETNYSFDEILNHGLENMSIQKLILPNEYDENIVFETLNARGLELSNYDLIKAFIFSFDEYNNHIVDYENHIENKNDSKITIDEARMLDLFRDYLAMKTGELYSKARVDSKQKTLYAGYKEYIKKCYGVTKMTLDVYKKEYKSLFKFKLAEERLESLKSTYCEIVPLQKYYKESNSLLKTLCYVEENESRFHAGLMEYSSYIVRKCLLNKKKVSWEHAKAANYLLENHSNDFSSSEIFQRLKEKNEFVFKTKLPSDEIIKKQAIENDFNNEPAVFIYCMLESKVNRVGSVYNFKKVSAEHIYPQNPEGIINEETAKLVNRIGNYCLLDKKSNSEQQNYNFSKKLNSKIYGDSAYLYTNKLQTKSEYKYLEEFNGQAILERSYEIIKAILEEY